MGNLHNHRAEGTERMVGRCLDVGAHALWAGSQAQTEGRAGGAGQSVPTGSGKGSRSYSRGPACGQVPTVEQICTGPLSLTTRPPSHFSRLKLSPITLPLDLILRTGLKSLDRGPKLSEPQLPPLSISNNDMSFAGRL